MFYNSNCIELLEYLIIFRKDNMKGNCALYGLESDLKNSHIIPKFVFDYLKSTGSKYMRTYEEPNKRVQDGPKEYLLCEKAEQDFSRRERWFANNIFFPYLKKEKTTFEYDENFAYFMISVLWRVLIDQNKHPSVMTDEKLDFLKDVQNEWKLFLSNFQFPINFNDLNIFVTDRVESHNTEGVNVDLYFSRVIDATIITDNDYKTVAVYVKFLRFMIWSVVKGNPNDCKDVKIKFSKGVLKLPQELKDTFFGGFVQNRIREIDSRPKATEDQQLKIAKEIKKNEKEFWESDAGKSMLNDYKNAKF